MYPIETPAAPKSRVDNCFRQLVGRMCYAGEKRAYIHAAYPVLHAIPRKLGQRKKGGLRFIWDPAEDKDNVDA